MDLYQTREIAVEGVAKLNTGYSAILRGYGAGTPHLTISLDKASISCGYITAQDLITLGARLTKWGTELQALNEKRE